MAAISCLCLYTPRLSVSSAPLMCKPPLLHKTDLEQLHTCATSPAHFGATCISPERNSSA